MLTAFYDTSKFVFSPEEAFIIGKPEEMIKTTLLTKESQKLQQTVEIYLQTKTESNIAAVMKAAEGMIHYFAALYGGGYSIEDLRQAGYEGLLKALAAYDPAYGTSFSTYAAHNIMGEIRHLVRKETRFYYPNCLNPLKIKADQLIQEKIEAGETPPSQMELADELNIREEALAAIMAAGRVKMEELDLSSIRADHYETFSLPIEDKITLSQLFSHLDQLQSQVIRMIFYQGMTQKEVADALGISQRQVSRIKDKSLKQMQAYLKSEEDNDES